jgi:hypothetical protein
MHVSFMQKYKVIFMMKKVNETCILFITAKLKIHLGFNKKLEKYLLD